jgi:hypothetical protein
MRPRGRDESGKVGNRLLPSIRFKEVPLLARAQRANFWQHEDIDT